MRLYVLCMVWILAFIPTQAFVLYINLSMHRTAYSWSETHNPAAWNEIIMVPSQGTVLFDRWIWLGSGLVVFIFFGLGKEAVSMYRSGLLAVGLGKIVPSLRGDSTRHSTSGTLSSFGSKAKTFIKRKSSVSSWYTNSTTSMANSVAVSESPKNMKFLETISEDQHMHEKPQEHSRFTKGLRSMTSTDPEKTTKTAGQPSVVRRMASLFRSNRSESQASTQGLALTGQPMTVRADVSTGHPSPTLSTHASANSIEVIVRKEIRQGSEAAETLSNKAYGGT